MTATILQFPDTVSQTDLALCDCPDCLAIRERESGKLWKPERIDHEILAELAKPEWQPETRGGVFSEAMAARPGISSPQMVISRMIKLVREGLLNRDSKKRTYSIAPPPDAHGVITLAKQRKLR